MLLVFCWVVQARSTREGLKLFQYMSDDAYGMGAKGNLTPWRAWFNARWAFSARLWTLCSTAKDINFIMEWLATGYDRKYFFVRLWEKLNTFDRFIFNVKWCRIFEDNEWWAPWENLVCSTETILRMIWMMYESFYMKWSIVRLTNNYMMHLKNNSELYWNNIFHHAASAQLLVFIIDFI